MQRLVQLFGIAIIALALLIFVEVVLNYPTIVTPATSRTPTATSTLSVEPGISLPPITLPSLEPVTSTTAPAKSTPKKITPKSTPVPAVVPVTTPAPAAPVVPASNSALDATASALRTSLVNILCDAPAGGSLHSISGSGIFIDPKGIILTNAHIGQYFLLADKGAKCTIRTGSPAVDKYNAALIYISPKWLRANANVLTQILPSGTGEYDFALLAVSKSATVDPLPDSFPFLPLATTPPSAGTPVVIATYAAQFLESAQIRSALSPTVVFGSVKDVFTFGTNTIDVLALGGSVAAQEGSSGGGVADSSGNLVGTITTSTVTGDTNTRSLDAITASYIRAEYASEMSSALDLLLAEPTAASIFDFAPKIPTLETIITASLP